MVFSPRMFLTHSALGLVRYFAQLANRGHFRVLLSPPVVILLDSECHQVPIIVGKIYLQ